MITKPNAIGLFDFHQGEVVDAFLHTGLSEEQIRAAQEQWEPIRKAAIERLLEQGYNLDQLIEKVTPVIKRTRYMQLIEFIRATHAEVSALMDAARRGAPVEGCTMYVTTFPCHECARNIVTSGMARVVYIEPYAKSLAFELHDDAIQLDKDTDKTKIPFTPFLGVSPTNYSNIFQSPLRKSDDGTLLKWNAAEAHPRVSGAFWSYLEYEKEDLKILRDTLR